MQFCQRRIVTQLCKSATRLRVRKSHPVRFAYQALYKGPFLPPSSFISIQTFFFLHGKKREHTYSYIQAWGQSVPPKAVKLCEKRGEKKIDKEKKRVCAAVAEKG